MCGWRGVVGVLAVVVGVWGLGPPRAASAASCWAPPVVGRMVDPFRAPPCPYCAGNRGIEYAVASPTTVRAATGGVVTFAGSVAGVGYVVVRLDNGWRLTYGRLSSRAVAEGDTVERGSVVGSASGEFFFGLRVGDDDYADPAPYLGEWVGRPRLIPTDGTPARDAPPPILRCGRYRRGLTPVVTPPARDRSQPATAPITSCEPIPSGSVPFDPTHMARRSTCGRP